MTMPRGKSANNQDKAPRKLGKYERAIKGEVEWGGFVNVKIDAETKLAYQNWADMDPQRFWALREDAVSEGLKYGLTWDGENGCFIASLTGHGVVGSKSRYCMVARSDRWEDATALLCFKHAVMAEFDWGDFRPSVGKFDKWG